MEIITFASTSNVLRVKILDSASTTGGGKTGLSSASAGLVISTIADNEAAATAYTQAGGTIETVTTLGTFAAPTATKCRFRELDPTGHPGIYEIQIADARYAVANARRLMVSISGAAGVVQVDKVIELKRVDLQDAVRAGLTALPNVAAGANGGLPLGDASGRVTVITYVGNTVQSGDAFARLGAPAGASIAADIGTRLAASAYTAPDNATITAIAGYVDTEIASIKTVTDKLDTALVLNAGLYRYTAAALALAPTGGSSGSVSTLQSVGGTEIGIDSAL